MHDQAKALVGPYLRTLRQKLEQMEQQGLVQRRRGFFKHGYGDALELTPEGYKSVK